MNYVTLITEYCPSEWKQTLLRSYRESEEYQLMMNKSDWNMQEYYRCKRDYEQGFQLGVLLVLKAEGKISQDTYDQLKDCRIQIMELK